MRLDLRSILHVPGASLPFSFALDLSGLDFYGHDLISIHTEFIVIFRSARFRRGKSVSDLKTFDSHLVG